jgi:hypothetical protein
LNTSAAPVRASTPPGLAVDGFDQTRVAWTEAGGGKPSHDLVRYRARRGTTWDPEPATIDPGIRGRTVTARLVPSDLGRLGMVVVSAFGTHRTVTETVRPDGTLGPKRTITWPSAGGALAWTPFAAQGGSSTWLAFARTLGIDRQDVALSRSR